MLKARYFDRVHVRLGSSAHCADWRGMVRVSLANHFLCFQQKQWVEGKAQLYSSEQWPLCEGWRCKSSLDLGDPHCSVQHTLLYDIHNLILLHRDRTFLLDHDHSPSKTCALLPKHTASGQKHWNCVKYCSVSWLA